MDRQRAYTYLYVTCISLFLSIYTQHTEVQTCIHTNLVRVPRLSRASARSGGDPSHCSLLAFSSLAFKSLFVACCWSPDLWRRTWARASLRDTNAGDVLFAVLGLGGLSSWARAAALHMSVREFARQTAAPAARFCRVRTQCGALRIHHDPHSARITNLPCHAQMESRAATGCGAAPAALPTSLLKQTCGL